MRENPFQPLLEDIEQLLNEGGRAALPEILERTLAALGCVTGTVHLLEQESGLLQLLAQRGIPESIMPAVQQIPVGKGMAGLAAERRQPVQVCNLQTDDSGDVRPAARDTKMEGAIASPMFAADGALIGTIGVAKSEPYDFDEKETELLLEIGKRIARTS